MPERAALSPLSAASPLPPPPYAPHPAPSLSSFFLPTSPFCPLRCSISPGLRPILKRTHLTEIGCIACDKLEEVGAGEKAGWLSDPSVLTALHSHTTATASSARSLILVLGWDDSSPFVSPIMIWHSLSMSGGRITVLEWLPFGDLLSLAVGTSDGVLLILSVEGDLIHKQIIHTACVLRLRFREMKGNSLQDADSQELSIVMAGVIARFDGLDIQSMLQRWFQEARSRIWEDTKDPEDESSFGKIPFQLWNVSKFGSCADAAIVGLMPPPLLKLQLTAFIAGQSSHRYYRAVTTGEVAVISAYMPSMDRSWSLVDTILSKVVPATFSTLASFSKMIWRSDQSSTKKSHVASQLFAKASPFTCLKDPPRKGEKLLLSPSGITDSLGRILLLDSQALVVVWLWKGYRDASCLLWRCWWTKIGPHQVPLAMNIPKVTCLCLAIHAPQ